MRITVISALVVLFTSSISSAQETKLNGMDFINPFRGDSAFISNHFEVAQNFSSTGFGEAVEMELKFHDYFGIFGKFDAGFGMNADPDDLTFSASSSFLSQEGIAVRIVRVEELGSQLGFRVKLEQVRSKFAGLDSSKIDVDEDYFDSLKGKDEYEIDPEEIVNHVKDDVKNNMEEATTNGKYSSFSGGVTFSLATAYCKNLASQISMGTLYGSRETTINDQEFSETLRDTSLNFALLGSLKPMLPVAVQAEYQYDIGMVGPSTHSVLGSIFYNNKDNNLSLGAGMGKVFTFERTATIGNLSGRYHF